MGKRRFEFCADYLKQKPAVYRRLEHEAFDQAKLEGEHISCRRGCTYCCSLYVEAMLKECEAIVYCLYHSEEALIVFLKNYPRWRTETGDIADRCTEALSLYRNSGRGDKEHQELADAFLSYKLRNQACPFLKEFNCLIYNARPFTCAAHFASSQAECCNPRNPQSPKIYRSTFDEELADPSIFGKQQKGSDLVLMPIKVHEILETDLYYFTLTGQLPGLEFGTKKIKSLTSILTAYLNLRA